MRLLLTGANGTVGAAVAAEARDRGWEVIGWDRAAASPDDGAAVQRNFEQVAPQAICHLAMGTPNWAAQLAAASAQRGIPFVFTSTASVFAPPGPHRPGDLRTATDDYGRYKAQCEDAVRQASDRAVIVRLGYQIGLHVGGNNMAEHLRQQARSGPIRASAGWVPATSSLPDTAAALCDQLAAPLPGLHHLDSNAGQAWTYPQIVAAISRTLGADWVIEPTDERIDDQRLLDSLPIAPLSQRLPLR